MNTLPSLGMKHVRTVFNRKIHASIVALPPMPVVVDTRAGRRGAEASIEGEEQEVDLEAEDDMKLALINDYLFHTEKVVEYAEDLQIMSNLINLTRD